ncbi:MAG: hypothetical protein COV70_03095 [Parcubacteria group bacterium CG11_big_fil_rev_8_21_14_0_20_39_22]|nr:MAG: hypothetical protein COV70_03095 [Parcubacteria group bacterium CG11_big_fil_rev_8_21_14_0_20_39_22]
METETGAVSFTVKAGDFEGPLDLLLALIEKRKLHISDISLSKVADDYIGFLERNEKFPLADTAHFILIASTLLLIKSKSLLPTLSLSEEEEQSIEDLEKRVKLYKRFKEISAELGSVFGERVLFSPLPRKMPIVFTPDKGMAMATIASAMEEMIKNFPTKDPLRKVSVAKVINLQETINSLTERIAGELRMSFRDFSDHGKAEKINVIVGFLAMLELVKRGIINVNQDKHFDDIIMETDGVTTPRY